MALMNINILLKICAKCDVKDFYKFTLLNHYTHDAINKEIPVYLDYLSLLDKMRFAIYCTEHNLINYIEFFLNKFKIAPKICVYLALKHHHKELSLMLIKYVNDSEQLFVPAIQYNNFKVFKIIMNNPTTDPNCKMHYAFRKICENGNLKMMKLLFNDKRFSIDTNTIICGIELAFKYKHILLVKYLDEMLLDLNNNKHTIKT